MLERYRIHILVSVAVLLIWLNLGSPPGHEVVQATSRTTYAQPSNQLTPPIAVMPLQLNRPMLEPASRDPFVPLPPPAPVVAKQVDIKSSAPFAPAPLPVAPPVNLTFMGRMTAPDGKQTVYATLGDTSLAMTVGQTLPNGYRVETINQSTIELSHPLLKTTARFELLAPPPFDIR
ncbi:MAG: hypothetical protein FD135_907 [Comamonadaceae bacterium]|nr:MAG: hypothetical protein FD135_907 [Comamonadaceae bacterium]